MKLSEVLEKIAAFGQANLSGQAEDYLLKKRQLTPELIEEFRLGFYPLNASPPVEWKWLEYHKIVCRDTRKSLRCPYEGRILFPIYNQYGELVTIQARLLDQAIDPTLERYNERKYWAASFDKSKVLYNLHKAIPIIRRANKVIVTEGQFDVITAWKFGVKNCVCTSGTALNARHIALLARYAAEVLVLFDGDRGGKEAIERLKSKHFAGLRIRFLTLPDDGSKEDLDSFLNKHGRQALVKLVKELDEADALAASIRKL